MRGILVVAFLQVITASKEPWDYNPKEMIGLLLSAGRHTTKYLLSSNSVSVSDEVTFWCINRRTNKLIQTYVDDPQIQEKINMEKPVAFFVHGFIDHVNRTLIRNILQTYPVFMDETICGVDWHVLANFAYSISAKTFVYEVADVVVGFIKYINRLGVPNDKITLIGHSLGAQVCGMVGSAFSGSIGKIFALDPAGPLFCFPQVIPTSRRLDPTDAKYVQVITTSSGFSGCAVESGHQNFYPNGGSVPQTGCLVTVMQIGALPEPIACSHAKSMQYFWWSLYPDNVMKGQECSSWKKYKMGKCDRSQTDVMGVYHTLSSGSFYLRTRRGPPSGSPSRNVQW